MLVVTAGAIVATNLFEGVLLGLALAVAKSAWETSHVHIETVLEADGSALRVDVLGNATFLRLPKLLDALDRLPTDRPVRLELSGLRHLDHACLTALEGWERQRSRWAEQREGEDLLADGGGTSATG